MRVWDAISYDPETGEFRWIIARANKKPGDLAGNVGPNGYRTIMVDYKSYYAHHLALAFRDGEFPPKESHVDHRNGVKSDNRLCNLRIVTPAKNGVNRQKNNKNNTSGLSGVYRVRSGKYLAFIQGKRLGLFDTFSAAAAARLKAYHAAVS